MKWNGHKRPYSEKTFGNLTNRATVDSPEFKNLPLTAQILFIRLCDLRSRFNVGKNWTEDGAFFRSNNDLMKDTGFNERTVVRAKQLLEQKGFIHATPTRPPLYTIHDNLCGLSKNNGNGSSWKTECEDDFF